MEWFVGRDHERTLFRDLLERSPTCRVLNVSGLGGVGKSTLLERFQAICAEAGSPTGLVNARRLTDPSTDREYNSVIEALRALLTSLKEHGYSPSRLEKRLAAYRKLHREVTERFRGSEALVSLVLRMGITTVRVGSKILPVVEPLARPLDAIPDELVDKVAKAVAGYRRAGDRDLLREPVEQLTPALLRDLDEYLDADPRRRVVLLFDEYELIPEVIDGWLRKLFDGAYGRLHPRAMLVIAGRSRLGQDWIGRGHSAGPEEVRYLPLGNFTRDEAVTYLGRHLAGIDAERAGRIADQLGDAGRLPLVLRLLVADPELLLAGVDSQDDPLLAPLANDLVERFLEGGDTSPERREIALAVSVARSFDREVVEAVARCCDLPEPRGHFEWLERRHFVNPNAPACTFYDLVRGVLLTRLRSSDPGRLRRLHRCLQEHYQERAAALGRSEKACKLALEAAYHQLSRAGSALLASALNALFRALPPAYHLTAEWGRTIAQVAAERDDLSGEQRRKLERLARLLTVSGSLSAWTRSSDRRRGVDPGMDELFSSLYRIEPPRMDDGSAELWLRYLESRMSMATGNGDGAARELLALWRQGGSERGGSTLLRFCVATDLGELRARQGAIPEAIVWNGQAMELARADGAPLREALALYQLSTNQKRQGDYRLTLANLDAAIELFERHAPSSNYELGRFMLDKANAHTYLNEALVAEQAFEAARDHLRDVSPRGYAELSHRLGWLKRVRGRLDEALEDHRIAVMSFEQLELGLHERTDVEPSTLPFLRAKALHSMANVLSEMHRHQEAVACYDQAREVFHRNGNRRHEALTQRDRAWSCYETAGPLAAEQDLIAALSLLSGDRDTTERSATELVEGWLELSRVRVHAGGRVEAAAEAIERAEALHLAAGGDSNPFLEARLRLQRALVHAVRGEATAATQLLDQVERYAGGTEPRTWSLLARATLVRALCARADTGGRPVEDLLAEAVSHAARWNGYLPAGIEKAWARLDAVAESLRPPGQKPAADVTEGIEQDEMIDVYDAEQRPLGQASSRLAHAEGMWHRSFHCWIGQRRADGVKLLILQQRGPFKRDFANYLDISAAGHYAAGESLEGGTRELNEELGIQVDASRLRRVAARAVDERLDNGRVNREFQDIYFLEGDAELSGYAPAWPEVAGVFRCRLDTVLDVLHGRAASAPFDALLSDPAQGELRAASGTITIDRFIPSARHYLRTVLELFSTYLDRAGDAGTPATGGSWAQAVALPDGSRWRPLWSAI